MIITLINSAIASDKSRQAIDSLKAANSHLYHSIDSLKTTTLVLTTKAENFDKVVYLQITAFVLIITIIIAIAGFIAWRSVFVPIIMKEKAMYAAIAKNTTEQQQTLGTFKDDFQKQFDDLKSNQKDILSQSMRAMSVLSEKEGYYVTSLYWGLSTIELHIETKPHLVEPTIIRLKLIIAKITKEMIGKENKRKILNKIDALKQLNDKKHEKDIRFFEEEFLKIYYSTP